MKDAELICKYEMAVQSLNDLGFDVQYINRDLFVVKKNDDSRESFTVDTIEGLIVARDALRFASAGREVLNKLPDHLRLCRNAQAEEEDRWRLYSTVHERYVGSGAATPEAAVQEAINSWGGFAGREIL